MVRDKHSTLSADRHPMLLLNCFVIRSIMEKALTYGQSESYYILQ